MSRARSKSECPTCTGAEFCYYHGLEAFGLLCVEENTDLVMAGLPALDQGLEGCEGFETLPGLCHHIDLVCEPPNREECMALIVDCIVSDPPSLTALGALLRFILDFLNSLVPTQTTQPKKELHCLCPDQHCPIFLLRLFSGSTVLLKALGPLIHSRDRTLVCLALKFSWRLYQLVQLCLPRCTRFKMLALVESPLRLGHSFWASLIRDACGYKELQETVFECLLELIVDRTEMTPEVDAEGRLLKVDLFCRDVKNPFFFPFAFEPIRGMSLEQQMQGVKHLFSALLGKCSSVPMYDTWVCHDHQLGVLQILSQLTLNDCNKDPNSPDLIHYACGFFTNVLTASLQSICFPSVAKQTMTTLANFGPSGGSYRRVNVIRHVLHATIAAVRDEVGMMTRDMGGLVFHNFTYLIVIVLQFVLFHGYETPRGHKGELWDHFPNLEELLQPLFLPPPTVSQGRRESAAEGSKPWKNTLSGPIKLHLAVRPALSGHGALGKEETKWEVLVEDIELLQKIDMLLKSLGLHTEVDPTLYRGEKALCQTLRRGHQVATIILGILQVLGESGFSLKANSALELRNPRAKRRSALLNSSHAHVTLSVCSAPALLSEEELKAAERPPAYDQQVEHAQTEKTREMVRRLTATIENLLVSKDARTVFKELNREEIHVDAPDSLRLRVIHEGTLTLCNGAASRQPMHVKLTVDALLYAHREAWLRGEHPHAIPLSTIKHLQMDVPFEKDGAAAEEKSEPLFFFAVVSKVESFILAEANQQARDEWVNLISVSVARARLESRGQGDCLEGLYVLASSSFKASPFAARVTQSASGTLYHYRQIMVPGRRAPALKTMQSDVVPLYSDQPFCCYCKSNFSFFNRRQHCARCGKGFCPKCLSRSNGQMFKLTKVCLICFEELKRKDAESKLSAAEHGAKTADREAKDMPKRLSGLPSMSAVFGKPRSSMSKKN